MHHDERCKGECLQGLNFAGFTCTLWHAWHLQHIFDVNESWFKHGLSEIVLCLQGVGVENCWCKKVLV